MRSAWRRLARDCRGSVISEFALLAPILMVVLLGVAEVTTLLRLDGKLADSAQTTADLVSQRREVSDAEVADIFRAAELVVAPFAGDGLRMALASVRFAEPDGSPVLDWQASDNGGAVANPLALAAGLGAPGESVIIVHGTFGYRPLFASLIVGAVQLEKTAVMRPRLSRFVARN